ncbi:helix-turn-helix domain-containing protein [Lutimaribacter marinistellae]|uniref:Helix-turn-helix domain-containing protein n=1 Tax=Lutimaribacter marinistellae TaxID=1820329 RepID=A0ABV7TQ13_9RHOB
MTDSDNVVALAHSLSSLGAELREMRKARDLTLKQLSKIAGISLSHISAIERGAANPSIDVLNTLAQALDVTPSWFFARRNGKGPLEQAFVVRRQNRRDLNVLYDEDAGALGYQDSLLSSSIGGQFYMGLAVYAPHSETPNDRMQTHEGETHGIVLEGELEMRIGDETVILKPGDSYSFDARIPHHARNRSDKTCKLIWAVSPVVIPKTAASQKTPQAEERNR